MATKPRGFETRDMTRQQVYDLADRLAQVGKENLADMVRTHGMSAEKNGHIKLSKAHWQEIDDATDFEAASRTDITLDEAVGFLSSAGMNVIVIDEDGVHEGVLHSDDSIEVDKGEQPDNPEDMSDDELFDLDKKMDLILDPKAEWSTDEKTVFIPQEVLDEADPDAELDAPAFPLCHCGCGGRTKGGRYIPGHDARHKGRLMREAFYLEGTEKGEASLLELQLRGWMKFYPAFAKNEAKRARRANLKRCEICGRPLSDEESIERGIGPVCAGKHN